MTDQVIQSLSSHGIYVLVFAVLADQSGLPVPAAPLLVAAGVLVRGESLHFWSTFIGCCLASWTGHVLWFMLGRYRGPSIINFLCRMSLTPDACVRRTQDAFSHINPLSLLFLRFVPGLDVLAQPLAAISGMKTGLYLAVTALGTMLWVGVYMGLGFAVGNKEVFAAIQALGTQILVLSLIAFCFYLVSKVGLRFAKNTREIPRLSAAELENMLQDGRSVIVVDMRRRNELQTSGMQIPGSKRLPRAQLRTLARHPQADTTAVVLCNCPGEAGSAYMASVFKRNGWQTTYALAGGFEQWRREGRRTEPLSPTEKQTDL